MEFFGLVAEWIKSKRRVNLYSEEQEQILRELEEEVRLAEAGESNLPNEYMVGPSYSSSTFSPAASGASVRKYTTKVGVNKLGMPYFETLEKRLEQEEEEFFSKEDFDIKE